MTNERATLYLETSVVSYLAARRSRDIIVLAHQELTRDWWQGSQSKFEIFVSEIVLEEARAGDSDAADARLKALDPFPTLPLVPEVEQLADTYMREVPFPAKAARDALHIALASVHGMEYLVTWNCRHIADGRVRRRVRDINAREGLSVPTICTPQELLDVQD